MRAAAFPPAGLPQQVPRGPIAVPGPTIPAGTFLPGTKVNVGSHRVIIEKYLSEGGFAHVYVVRLPQPIDGQEKAVLKRVAVPDKDTLANMRTEVETMKKLKGHQHIVRYMDSHASGLKDGGFEVFLLMEYCDGGGLIDFMNTRLQNRLTEPEILKIFSDTCHGVASMHYLKPPLLHRDLKVENILITGTGTNKQFKLCDFGSAASPRPAATNAAEGRLIEEDVQKHTTMQYRSPEMIDVYRKQPIDEKADIWALGVLLYKLCYYTTPFEEQGQMAILNASFKYPAHPLFSDRLKRLIAMMLQEHPAKRPNIYQVYKEVCVMRHKDCPLKDIYSRRTVSEARGKQELPASLSEQAPIGISKVAPVEKKLTIPEVTPMRRGRPMSASASGNPSPSPSRGRPVASDPFAALDGKQGSTAQAAQIDELSEKFPSLDQFSLLHDSGSKFAFDKKPATTKAELSKQAQTQQQDLSSRVTQALADDAFLRPKSDAATAPGYMPEVRTPTMQTHTGRSNMATQTSFPVSAPEKQSRPSMVSTGTMTSSSPPRALTPDISSRPIFRIPDRQARSTSRTREDSAGIESTSRTSLSAPRPSMLEHRSKSQTATVQISAATAKPTVEPTRPDSMSIDLNRSRSTNQRSRPISGTFSNAAKFFHGRSSSQSTRPDRTSGVLIDMSDQPESEPQQIESNVDFLKQMEEEDASKRKDKRLSGGFSLQSKRSSMPAAVQNTKQLLAGKFGDAFKRFESSEPTKADEVLIDRTGEGGLTPIAGSVATDGRSDDGRVLEETEDVSPEMRRELERRQLSDEERRVAEAAAEYRQKVATNGTGGRIREAPNRASAIQNRVQALLDESNQKSPTKTAAGYGRFTNEAPARDEEPQPQSQKQPPPQQQVRQLPSPQQAPVRPATTPATTTLPDRAFVRPSAPPKPQVLRTGGGPGVARKPANLTGGGTGQSLLQQRLMEDQANSQAGHGRASGQSGQAEAVRVPDEDWETNFSKKYPSLGNLEMEETVI